MATDNRTAAAFERMAPYTGLMDLERPYQVSDHCMLPAPVISTLNNRLEVTDELCKPYGG